MTQIPNDLASDANQELAKECFKQCGYGHFGFGHAGSVTSQKRGVRICFTVTRPDYSTGKATGGCEWATAHVEVRKAVTKKVWVHGSSKNEDQTLTEYKKMPQTYYVAGNHKGGKDFVQCATPQDMFDLVIKEADSFEGDKAITQAQLKKGILQNVIFDDVKTRLVKKYKDWSGFEVAFHSRAKMPNALASLKIRIPAQNYELGVGEKTSSYQLGEVYLQLGEGQFDIILGEGAGARSDKVQTPIPIFADPKFDPELIWEYSVKAIEAMIPARDFCTERRREMDLLDIRIKKEKQRLREEFGAIWQSTWYSDE